MGSGNGVRCARARREKAGEERALGRGKGLREGTLGDQANVFSRKKRERRLGKVH